MSTRHLAETAVDLVTTYLEDNLPTALAGVIADIPNPNRFPDIVTLEAPRTYFVYPKIKGYTLPAVMVIVDSVDFRPAQQKANYISAVMRMAVVLYMEERDEERLTIKAYRYLDAFHNVLAQTQIPDSHDNAMLTIIVERAGFSPHYTIAGQDPQGLFRKELQLECSVEHWINF